ncbi:hypothetical protein TNCV_2126061 [Trichonephila clavipes]|nr:hypothetical protein TNCV_2126061 [Trichonephila clavipes]
MLRLETPPLEFSFSKWSQNLKKDIRPGKPKLRVIMIGEIIIEVHTGIEPRGIRLTNGLRTETIITEVILRIEVVGISLEIGVQAVHETTGKTPAELFLCRKLITPFQKLVLMTDGAEFVVGNIEKLFKEARQNTRIKHEKWVKETRS